MRIAVCTRFLTRIGGIETYLESVLPALAARGHDISLWHESDADAVDPIVPARIPSYRLRRASSQGIDAVLRTVSDWSPDVIFSQGIADIALEARLDSVAPLAIFLHAYHGTCISGTKTHLFPTAHVCSRALGPGCLVHYYPRRCGGWSPVSMVTLYAQQRQRQALLRRCRAVVTLSEHMRLECIAQGVNAAVVTHVPAFTPADHELSATRVGCARAGDRTIHLLFAGRMEQLKGAQVLLNALNCLDDGLRRSMRVTFAGDGRDRARLEQQAARIARDDLDIRFVGWLSPTDRSTLFEAVDLLVVPSIWPEPFGLIGLEAAAAGVPAVAFDVGGVREWLADGITGRLVRGLQTSGDALARAIEDCASDPVRLQTWGMAAREASRRRTLTAHVDALETVLHGAARLQP